MNKYFQEAKEIVKNYTKEPGRVFGLIYPLILTLVTIIGFVYVMHLNDSARQKINPAIPDSTVQKDLTVVQAKTIPPIDLTKIGEPTPELINKGKGLFQANCTSCHGEEGKGNGPASTGLNPPPRNFTSKSGWKNGPKLTQIFTTLQEGIPGSAMVAYELLTPEEKFSIAHYIRSTFVPDPPKDAPEDFTALDQLYNLSKGKEVAAQIPVLSAEKIVLGENDSLYQKISRTLRSFQNSGNDEGLRVFSRVIKNEYKAVASLCRSTNWKGSQAQFYDFLTLNVNQNGFNGNVFNLKKDELNKLYTFVLRVF